MEIFLISIGILLIIYIEIRLYKPRNVQSLQYHLKMERTRLVEGETGCILETITNKGLLLFPVINTTMEIAGKLEVEEENTTTLGSNRVIIARKSSLRWFQRATVPYTFLAKARGVHQIYCTGFYYTDALRFTYYEHHLRDHTEIIVYPKILPIDQILPIPLNLFGDHFVRRWIMEDYFFPSGVRDYVHGDNLRFIDWKKTARYNEMKTRTYDYTNTNEVIIVLNLQTTGSVGSHPELIEDIIRVGASLLYAAIREGFAIGLFANGGCIGYMEQTLVIPPSQNQPPEQLNECLARLRNFESQPFQYFLDAQQQWLGRDANIVMITGYMNEDIYGALLHVNATAQSLKIITLKEVAEEFQEGLSFYPAFVKGAQKDAK